MSLTLSSPAQGSDLGRRILIVDDDAVIREGLRSILESLGIEVAGEADNGRSGIEQAKESHPDVILLDVSMPVMGGFAAAGELRVVLPALRIIFISQYSEPAYSEEALHIGAAGYVLKQRARADLGRAIDAALSGGTFVSAPAVGRSKKASTDSK